MRINIIGGGPAGLYFAILIKKANHSHEVCLHERNGPDDTFGWGVVFSGKTLTTLREADPESHAEITQSLAAWDNVDVVHNNAKVSVHGNSFSGIARIALLKILQRRATKLGVELNFHSEISDIDSLRDAGELLVAADGVNSLVRQHYAEQFAPSLDVRSNRYVWYGTNRLFHGLTLTFRESEAGVFAAHSYKFNQDTSTFIVECDAQTWDNAGFVNKSDDETRQILSNVFTRDLDGHPLLSNNSRWIRFVLVKNAHWSFDRVVLLGDALHTAHFSIGSGTKLAMEDAIELSNRLRTENEVREALAKFERNRRPVIEDYQAAAFQSMLWFENVSEHLSLRPMELAFAVMTRSGRMSFEDLRKRDPEFISRYEVERNS